MRSAWLSVPPEVSRQGQDLAEGLVAATQKTATNKMISALCSVAIAFSPTAPLQPRAAAMHMTRAATSEVAMINLFGNSGARSPALKGERVGTFGKGGVTQTCCSPSHPLPTPWAAPSQFIFPPKPQQASSRLCLRPDHGPSYPPGGLFFSLA